MTVLQRYSRRAAMIALPLFTFSSLASAEVVLEVDLSVTDQITITATSGLSAATVSGADGVGFYLEDFFSAPYGNPIEALVSGDLTSFLNTPDLSPSLYSGTVDVGLNVFSYTDDPSSDFVAGTQAFSGSGTWDVTPADYAAFLAGSGSGDVWAIADDVSDLATASIIGQYTLVGGGGPGTQYCPGDGIYAPCPCANINDGSMSGCDWQSLGGLAGADLTAAGSNVVANNDTFLTANNVEADFGVFFGADNQVAGILNDGIRCAGGNLIRLIPPTNPGGSTATHAVPLQMLDAAAVPGMTRNYQYWFRTPNGPCGTTANTSNGYSITWM